MKNCIVTGFGRSGTSLMGGILHQAGYYMGEDLYPPRHSNPRGFFENALINGINERIMAPYDRVLREPQSDCFKKAWSPFKPNFGHRWLSWIEPETEITFNSEEIAADIRKAVSREGFACKDPRFNYTLDSWKLYLPEDTVYICMFREPAVTIQSVLDECASADYLSDFHIDRELAEEMWINSYRSILSKAGKENFGNWIFVSYDQLLRGERMDELSELTGVGMSGDFVSRELNRTRNKFKADSRCLNLHYQLCDLAEKGIG